MKKILYALTTYDAYAYIDFSIVMHKKFGNDVIVIDDGSCSEKLLQVCLKHNVPLLSLCSTPANRFDTGDVRSMAQAVQYAYFHGYEYIAKQSRRWIWLENPTPHLLKLIDESHGSTFSYYELAYRFGFRTEFAVYKTDIWINAVKDMLKDLKNPHESVGLVEHYVHVLAKKYQPFNDEKYISYMNKQNTLPGADGYVYFEFMGNNKNHQPDYALFHNTHSPECYLQKAKEIGLDYELMDFKLIDSHKQKSFGNIGSKNEYY